MKATKKPAKDSPRSYFKPKESRFQPRPFTSPAKEVGFPASRGPGFRFNLADIDIFPKETVQPKLTFGPVGDRYERVAVQRQELEEEEELMQGKFTDECVQCQTPEEEEEELIQGKFASGLTGTLQAKEEAPPNRTGMPDHLKSGLESLSGMDLSGVRVHYSSSKPAQLNALAYTQGQEIHLAPGQGKHLPHEGWHAVQQKQGRVKPTMQAKGVSINDDAALEREADVMGTRATQRRHNPRGSTVRPISLEKSTSIQRMPVVIQRLREYEYGAANVTPHVHCYAGGAHLKDAYGKRFDLVRNGARVLQARINDAFDAIREQYPKPDNNVRVGVLDAMKRVLREYPA